MLRKQFSLQPWFESSELHELFNHFSRFREDARLFKTSNSSFNRYRPSFNVSRKKVVSMIFVRQSATWAPLWTHLNCTPSASMSLIASAFNWVLCSAQFGVAVLVTKSKSDLQSVAATLSGRLWALWVAVANVSGNCFNVLLGCFQLVFASNIQAQHNRIHDKWSNTELRETVSAANVLVTTLWIFLQPQDSGETGQDTFSLIKRFVPMIILPVCELGLLLEANDASENARKRKSSTGMGWICIVVSWNFLASWSAWFAEVNVEIVAELIADCNMLSLLARSGRVCTAAYWRLPIRH